MKTNGFVVIENFCGIIEFARDEEGNVKVFDNVMQALDEAEQCQNGKIVEL
jgi:hypothetical protein